MVIFSSLGAIRSNLVSFGADQYRMPDESEQLKVYFSLQMVIIKCGSFIGRILTPTLREDVKCLGENDCYALAFGIPTIAIILAFITLFCGRKTFIRIPPYGNIFLKMIRCIKHAVSEKIKLKNSSESKKHWLEYAEDKYGVEFVNATKIILGNLIIFLPTAVYWAVYVQQGSRWIFQAMKMNGDIGFYTIKPDQMISFNSLFSIILLPFCNYIIFPLLGKIGLTHLLHRITIGGFLCAISFIMAAFVQIAIEKSFISMLWLLPQFAILALSENFVYISLVNFAYSETPDGMKSVMTGFVFLIIALGNLLITLISGFKLFQSQTYEFLFFACILFIDMIIFIPLSIRYINYKRKIIQH